MSQEADGQKVDTRKRKFLIAATSAVGGVAVAGVAVPLVMSMMPSARAKAAGAPVEVDISKVEPGMLLTVEWRGKPVWIVNRSKEMLALLGNHDDKLIDPKSEQPQQPVSCQNKFRSIKEEYLVAVNSAIYSRTGGSQGIGFAIPVSIARQVMEQIIKSGSVTRGWVGIEVQDLTHELAESFGLKNAEGALIAGVLKGGPAEVGGVRPGDVLLSVNSKTVVDSSSLLNLIADLNPGASAQLKVSRKQKQLELKIQVERRPIQRAPEPQEP